VIIKGWSIKLIIDNLIYLEKGEFIMEFFDDLTMDDLKAIGKPTYDNCEHYLIKPHPHIKQTIVIELENGKHLTVSINPDADNIDVKLHGDHSFQDLGEGDIKAFYNIRGHYNK
jgi:hypothetical protein